MDQSSSQSFSIPNGVMRFNVSGTVIEMSREMLEIYPKSLLRELAHNCPEGAEAFIDRDPSGLRTIVDYLHCGGRVLYKCNTIAKADFLEKEAEYYGIDDLAIKCASLYEFKPRCEVNWRPDVVEYYYPLFAKCIIDPQLTIPFTYERNSHIIGELEDCQKKIHPAKVFMDSRCIACEESYEPKASNVFVFSLQEWGALKHHMLSMCGIVEKLVGNSCLMIRWSNGILTHLPKSAVRVVIEDI